MSDADCASRVLRALIESDNLAPGLNRFVFCLKSCIEYHANTFNKCGGQEAIAIASEKNLIV